MAEHVILFVNDAPVSVAPGAQATAEYAATATATGSVPPALAFGYGVIDADDIAAALVRLRRALQAGADRG